MSTPPERSSVPMRHFIQLIGPVLVAALVWLSGCSLGGSPATAQGVAGPSRDPAREGSSPRAGVQRPDNASPEQQTKRKVELLSWRSGGIPRGRLSLEVLAEVLDAVEAELLRSTLCNGGEKIDLALWPHPRYEHVVEVIYSIPGVLRLYRFAYIQTDGLVVLADNLSFRTWARRSSTQPIPEEDFELLYDLSPTRIRANLRSTLRGAASAPGRAGETKGGSTKYALVRRSRHQGGYGEHAGTSVLAQASSIVGALRH